MDKSKRRKKKKRRHDKQITEGTRKPREKTRKVVYGCAFRRKVRLSELNPSDVKKVLDIVKRLDI